MAKRKTGGKKKKTVRAGGRSTRKTPAGGTAARKGAREKAAGAAKKTRASARTRASGESTTRARRSARETAAPAEPPPRPLLVERRSPETLRVRSITPGLTVSDLERSRAFYRDALGFVEGEGWTEGDSVVGVMLKAGVSELGLTQDDWAKGRDRVKGLGVRLWLRTVQDVDDLASRARAAGATLTEEPQDRPWGARAFSVDDPDGYHLTIFRQS